MAHLKHELMHGIWVLLLTPEFIYAYAHGIVKGVPGREAET
jgi:hypothetical protein